MTNIKICFCVTSPETVNAFIKPQMASLSDSGFDIYIVTGNGHIDSFVKEKAHSVIQIPISREIDIFRDIKIFPKLYSAIRSIAPKVVIASTPKISPLALIAAKKLKVPVRIFHVRGIKWESLSGVKRHIVKFADSIAANSATRTLAVSNSTANHFVLEGITKSRPIVLGRGASKGVDQEIFKCKDFSNKNNDSFTIGFVGRLNAEKGIDIFPILENYLRVSKPLKFEIVGQIDPTNPISIETLQTLMGSKQISLTLERQSQEEIAERMQKWDLMVFPSHREGLPNVVIEAASCGVPTVGWDVTGVRDAIIESETGWLVEFGDTTEMIKTITKVLDEGLYVEAGAKANQFVHENFDHHLVTTAFINFLKKEVEVCNE